MARILVGAVLTSILCGVLPTSANADEHLTLATLVRLFRHRYAERAPGRTDSELATRKAELQLFKLDPEATVTQTKALGSEVQSREVRLSQGTPFGTTVALSHVAARGDPATSTTTERRGAEVTQELLKGGPWHGMSREEAFGRGYDADLLKASLAQDAALVAAIEAFVLADEALVAKDTVEKAEAFARRQHTAVTELVASGYKPKADLLVSEAAQLRASLNVVEAGDRLARAMRRLEAAIWQSSSDPPLALAQDAIPAPSLTGLESTSWPELTPKARLAQLEAERSRAAADLAAQEDLPKLALGYGAERVSQDGASPEVERRVTLSFQLPLVGALRRDGAAIASLAARNAEDLARDAKRDAERERADFDAQAATMEHSLDVAIKLKGLAEKTREIESQKYADGKSSIAEVRRVQEDLDRAALSVLAARRALILERIKRAAAAGRLAEVFP